MALDPIKFNPFQQPVQATPKIGSNGYQGKTGGTSEVTGGQTAYERDMADFRQYLPSNNGTGELQPKNDATMCFMA